MEVMGEVKTLPKSPCKIVHCVCGGKSKRRVSPNSPRACDKCGNLLGIQPDGTIIIWKTVSKLE
jgi:hypothetical protein